MLQEAFLSSNNPSNCQQEGHVEQDILGYCLNQECQIAQYCQKCLTHTTIHQGHYDDCIGWTNIKKLLKIKLAKYEEEEKNFQDIHAFLRKSIEQIKKHFLYKSKNPESRILKKLEALEILGNRINQKIQLCQQLLKYLLNSQMYIKQIKNIFFYKDRYDILKRILLYFQQKQKQMIRKTNVSNLIMQAAIIYENKGRGYMQSEKQYELAIEMFNQSLVRNPNLLEAHIQKGYALSYLENEEDAINSFQKALRITKEMDTYLEIAYFLQCRNSIKQAFKLCDMLIELTPQNPESFYEKAKILENFGFCEQAFIFYVKAYNINSSNFVAGYKILQFARRLIKQENFNLGIKCYDYLIELYPWIDEIAVSKSKALRKQEESKEGFFWPDETIWNEPNSTNYNLQCNNLKYINQIKCYHK